MSTPRALTTTTTDPPSASTSGLRRSVRFQGMFDGYYHLFAAPEEQWAYWGRWTTSSRPPGDNIALRELLSSRVLRLTTNVDHGSRRSSRGAPLRLPGNAAHLRCGQPCHDGSIRRRRRHRPGRKTADFASRGRDPRCPRCHRQLLPWWRDPVLRRILAEQVDRYRTSSRGTRIKTPAVGTRRRRDDPEHHQAAVLAADPRQSGRLYVTVNPARPPPEPERPEPRDHGRHRALLAALNER